MDILELNNKMILFEQKKHKRAEKRLNIKTLFGLFFVLISHVCLSGELSFNQKQEVKQLFFDGVKSKAMQNYSLAELCFSGVLKLDVNNHPAMYEMALIRLSQSKTDSAVVYLEKAILLKPDNEWYLMLLSDLYQGQKQYEKLLKVVDKLIEISPEKIDYLRNKATVLIELGRYDEAIALYTELEKKSSEEDEVLIGHQKIYLKQGKYDKAIADLEREVQKKPSQSKYYLLLSLVYEVQGKNEKVIEVLEQAKQKSKPSNVEINLRLADAYREAKKLDKAINELKEAFVSEDLGIEQKIRIFVAFLVQNSNKENLRQFEELSKVLVSNHPNEASAYSMYANILLEIEQIDEAISNYLKAVEIEPKLYTAWENLLRAEILKKDYRRAIEHGENALTFFPNQSSLYYLLSVAFMQTKQPNKAIENLELAISFPNDNKEFMANVWSSLGDAYHEINKIKDSDDAYEKAIELNPNNTYALNNYAYYLSLRNDKLDKAEQMSALSNKLDTNNASFQDTYAWVLFRLKKYSEAKLWIEKAISNEKELNYIQVEHYGDILYKLNQKEKALEQWKKALTLGSDSEMLKKKINEGVYFE